MKNLSGMFTFQTANGPAACVLAEHLRLLQTTFKLDARQRASWRTYAGDGIFRLSVGLEDPEDLIADLDHALSHL